MKGKSLMESAYEYLGLNLSELKEYYKEQQIMSTKKTLRIKLDAEIEVNFSNWDFSDDEKTKEDYFKKVILDFYFERNGYDEVEVTEKKDISLFETMADMFCPNKKQ